MTDRFTSEPVRFGYHGCDNCGNLDFDTMFETGKLDTMWTDNETGETICTRCKEVIERATVKGVNR